MSDFDTPTAVDRYRHDTRLSSSLACDDQRALLDDAYRLFASELSPAQAREVFGQFGPDECGAFTVALDQHARECFLPDHKRRDAMFKLLAHQLSGEQMATLAMCSTGGQREIGKAVGALPASRTADKLEFIAKLKSNEIVGLDWVRPEAGEHGSDQHLRVAVFGAAIGECLLGLRGEPAAQEAAIGSLEPFQLQMVIVGALGIEKVRPIDAPASGPSPITTVVAPQPALDFLSSVSRLRDDRVKCLVQLCAERVEALLPEIDAAMGTTAAPLTRVLDRALAQLRKSMSVDFQMNCVSGAPHPTPAPTPAPTPTPTPSPAPQSIPAPRVNHTI